MTKPNLILWAVLILVLSFAPLINDLKGEYLDSISVAMILIFGIPHGALDQRIQLNHSKVGVIKFYTYYLGAIAFNVALWFVFPSFALALFLLLSAFHFGQSQFEGMFKVNIWPKIFFLTWGIAVISNFLFFNHGEFLNFISSFDQMYYIDTLFSKQIVTLFFGATNGAVLTILLVGLYRRELNPNRVFSELIVLASIFVLANLFSFLFGFALFFVIIHAFNVTIDEIHYLSRLRIKSAWHKVKQFLPHSLLSFIGLSFLYFLLRYEFIAIDMRLLFLIIISSITIPHAFVMNLFYKVRKKPLAIKD